MNYIIENCLLCFILELSNIMADKQGIYKDTNCVSYLLLCDDE